MKKERVYLKYEDLKNAFQRLEEAVNKPLLDDIVIDAVIQRFEFTFELAWKVMKDYLEYQGINQSANGPRDCIKEAFKINLIENGDEWIEMLISRNLTSHIYDKDTAQKIFNDIKQKYIKLINEFIKEMNNILCP